MAKNKKTLDELLQEAIVKDAPYEVPGNWVKSNLNSIIKFEKGKKPKVLLDECKENAIPYVTIKCFESNKPNQYTFLSETNKVCEKDDVIVVWDGARAGLVGMGSYGALGSTLCKIKCNKLNNKYIYYYFLGKYDLINVNTKGTGIPHVNPEFLKTLTFPVPPLKEQERIVEKIEGLFEKLDKAKELIEEVREDFEKRKASILEKAFRGELTEKWREENNIENEYNILLRELKERKELYSKVKSKFKPNFMNYDDKDIVINETLPNTWVKCPVGLICDCIVPGRDKPKSFTGHIPWITIPNVLADLIEENSSELKLSEEEIITVKGKIIPVNSIIMSCVGNFGISAVVNSRCVINQQLHAFLPSNLIESKYLMYHIKILKKYMKKIATSTTIAYINKTGCNSLPINLPPLEEQKEIVRILDKLLDQEGKIEKLTNLENQIELTKKAILAKAFRGELGTNDPSEESAMELLKEVLQEKL